jgi:hypothetical protein
MDLAAVYAEIETRLKTISGLRVVKQGEKPQVPGAMVLLPDSIARTTYRGGSKVSDVVVLILVGKAVARQAQADLLAYASSSGARSVSAVLDPYAGWVACTDVTLTETTVDTATIAGAPDVYLVLLFHLDITGPGA